MSLANQNMEQLFAAAKGLPSELNLKEVELTFLNPAPLPPARLWYGSYLKFFTMLSFLLAGVFALTLSSPTEPLTNSPLLENTLNAAVAKVPTSLNITKALDSKPTRTLPPATSPTPRAATKLPALALSPLLAPAAAPPIAPVLNFPLLSINTRDQQNSTSSPITARERSTTSYLPSPIFNGEWKLRKRLLHLSLREVTSDAQEQLFFLTAVLTNTEIEALQIRGGTATKVERAAGTLLVYGGKKRGTFKFIPNASFRDHLNNIGLGDRQLPEGENPRIPVLPRLIKPGVCSDTDHPRELLWLKYFVYNVNDSYLKVLHDHGYTDRELVGLYHLPDYGVKRLTLINLLSLTDQLFAERVPVKDLARMSWRITYLNSLIMSGHTGMTLEAFWNKKDKKVLGLSLLGSTEALKSPLIGLKGTTALALNNEPLVGTLGTPFSLFTDSMTRLLETPLIDFELPDNWGSSSPSGTGKALEVSAFSKLVVKGNVRLYLNYSDAPRQIVVFASPDARLALRVKQSGGRLKLTNTHPKEQIDIEVSGPLLESIRTAGNTLFFKKTIEKE